MLRGSRGEAAGIELGSSFIERITVNAGTAPILPDRCASGAGSYFPPPVKAVEIPKAGGAGVRVLGVPTVADRVAQTVARMYLEPKVEPIFHPDSYGYVCPEQEGSLM